MTTTVDLTPLWKSRRFPQYAEEIAIRLRNEREARERFYDEMDDSQKVEFIDGEVIVHSPARNAHLMVKTYLAFLLHGYVARRQLGVVLDEKCLCVFSRNDYEPDLVFFRAEKADTFVRNTMKHPVPDFIVEILSDSTEQRDRGVKFEDYETHGVGEYWIINADAEIVEQYVAKDGEFQLQLKSGSGDIESVVIKGFRIPIRAMFDRVENIAAMDAQVGRST